MNPRWEGQREQDAVCCRQPATLARCRPTGQAGSSPRPRPLGTHAAHGTQEGCYVRGTASTRSKRRLLTDHVGDALFYSDVFGGAQWLWADLKNNEVDARFYRLNNEVVCFREQPSPSPHAHKDTIPPTSTTLWWSWYMHKQHFHGAPSIAGLGARCPIAS